VDGDGRPDLLANEGWWTQPAPGDAAREWAHHPFRFAEKGGASTVILPANMQAAPLLQIK